MLLLIFFLLYIVCVVCKCVTYKLFKPVHMLFAVYLCLCVCVRTSYGLNINYNESRKRTSTIPKREGVLMEIFSLTPYLLLSLSVVFLNSISIRVFVCTYARAIVFGFHSNGCHLNSYKFIFSATVYENKLGV